MSMTLAAKGYICLNYDMERPDRSILEQEVWGGLLSKITDGAFLYVHVNVPLTVGGHAQDFFRSSKQSGGLAKILLSVMKRCIECHVMLSVHMTADSLFDKLPTFKRLTSFGSYFVVDPYNFSM